MRFGRFILTLSLMDQNRKIPDPIKREVRKRCGFGCVICGCPIYEYDHMMDWAIYKRHVASEITLLCSQHHTEKTSGLLPLEKVLEANKTPYNLRKGISKPYNLHFYGKKAFIGFGNDEIDINDNGGAFSQVILFLIHGMPLFECLIQDDTLNLSLILFDKNGKLALQIINNELIIKSDVWDIYFIGNKLKVNKKHHDVMMEIEFKAPNKLIIRKGTFYYKNIEIKISKEGISITNLSNGSNAKARLISTGFYANSLAIVNLGKSDFPGYSFIRMSTAFG
jgi:hypothetical protein